MGWQGTVSKEKGEGTLDYISEEFVFARTGEPLEARIRNSDSFQQQSKSLHEASKAFTRDSVASDECWKAFDRLENEWSKYNIQYEEESYRLGFEDGVQLASEREIRAKGSVLDVKDMAHLVYLYDAVKKLNMFLLGEWDNYDRDSGVLKELDRVCRVIEDGVCAEIRLRSEDESYECLTGILDNSAIAPEERAKMLTEYGGA